MAFRLPKQTYAKRMLRRVMAQLTVDDQACHVEHLFATGTVLVCKSFLQNDNTPHRSSPRSTCHVNALFDETHIVLSSHNISCCRKFFPAE
jgi:hypothetical protein